MIRAREQGYAEPKDNLQGQLSTPQTGKKLPSVCAEGWRWRERQGVAVLAINKIN